MVLKSDFNIMACLSTQPWNPCILLNENTGLFFSYLSSLVENVNPSVPEGRSWSLVMDGSGIPQGILLNTYPLKLPQIVSLRCFFSLNKGDDVCQSLGIKQTLTGNKHRLVI